MQLSTSSIALLVANVIPLGGVLFAGWSAFEVVFVYWLENAIIGILNVVRMLGAPLKSKHPLSSLILLPIKLFVVGFFVIHYGGFMAGHLVFIVALMIEEKELADFLLSISQNLWLMISFVSLFLSHLVSHIKNFWIDGERHRSDTHSLMSQPYKRIVILHVALIFGGWVTMALGSPIGVLLILVILKTGVDLYFHMREHRKLSNNSI